MDRYMTAGDAAQILKVTPAAVRLMADRGDLQVAARTEGGIRLFDRSDVEHLAAQRYEEKQLADDGPAG